jgi:acetyltransferase-like isoleucine patch superfamily enzyme
MATHAGRPHPSRREPLQRRIVHFRTENGLYLTARHAIGRVVGGLRSRMIASSLGAPPRFWVGADAVILGAAHISIGEGFVAGSHLWLEATSAHGGPDQPIISIGKNVTLGDFVRISANARIRIGDDVLMGSKIYIADHNHGHYDGDAPSDPRESPHLRALSSGGEVTVGDRAWIGESVTILRGASIGDGSIIGANSVVTSSIPPLVIAVGSPARVIKRFDVTTKRWQAAEVTNNPTR